LLVKAKAQLNLNTSQQLQWDNAVAQSMSAHEAARASFAELRSAMQAELGKDQPDLAAVASVAEGAHQQNEAQRKAARDAWLALYATFTPEQKSVVRDTLKAGIARMEARHAVHGPHSED
jgi:Spy/CpxP family protein refolding chaperone